MSLSLRHHMLGYIVDRTGLFEKDDGRVAIYCGRICDGLLVTGASSTTRVFCLSPRYDVGQGLSLIVDTAAAVQIQLDSCRVFCIERQCGWDL